MMETELKQENQQSQEPIAGWLSLFLWVGVGVGAVVSIIRTIVELSGIGWTPLSILIFTSMLGSLLAVAILTIRAFYKREPNAVALAMTYIAMIVVDAIMQVFLVSILEDDSMYKGAIRSFLWAIVWFSYLVASEKVKRIIPISSRRWTPTEIILLAVFVLSSIVYCAELKKVLTDPLGTHLVSKEYIIKQAVESVNEELPSDVDGILLEKVTMEGLEVVYNYRFPNNSLADMDLGYLKKFSIAHKQEVLQEFAIETDEELTKFYSLIYENGYDICYYFRDKDNQFVYSVVTTLSEYKRAREAGNNFKCDRNSWKELLSQVNNELPSLYMGDCMLEEISVDFVENQVRFEVKLPELENYVLTHGLTKDFLHSYIIRNMDDLSDYVWTMAGIDKMDLIFHFVTNMGHDHATIAIPYESYCQSY